MACSASNSTAGYSIATPRAIRASTKRLKSRRCAAPVAASHRPQPADDAEESPAAPARPVPAAPGRALALALAPAAAASARAGIQAALSSGFAAVRKLDIVVANQLQDDPMTRAVWERDRRVDYSRRTRKAASPPPVEPAVTAVTAPPRRRWTRDTEARWRRSDLRVLPPLADVRRAPDQSNACPMATAYPPLVAAQTEVTNTPGHYRQSKFRE